MEEKLISLDHDPEEAYLAPMSSSNNARRRGFLACFPTLSVRRLCYITCITLAVWITLHTVLFSYGTSQLPATKPAVPEAQPILSEKNVTKVALEAHIMSKCPDAKACLQMLVVPAMEQISDKVDFRLSYIGRSVKPHHCTG